MANNKTPAPPVDSIIAALLATTEESDVYQACDKYLRTAQTIAELVERGKSEMFNHAFHSLTDEGQMEALESLFDSMMVTLQNMVKIDTLNGKVVTIQRAKPTDTKHGISYMLYGELDGKPFRCWASGTVLVRFFDGRAPSQYPCRVMMTKVPHPNPEQLAKGYTMWEIQLVRDAQQRMSRPFGRS